jgi:diguanylate cyclase (GGDEF)-like protein
MLPTFLPADTRTVGIRGVIACAGSFVAFLGFWLVQWYAQRNPGAGANYDAVVLDLFQLVLGGFVLATLGFGVYCWRLRQAAAVPRWLLPVLTVVMALGYTLLGLAYGFYTTPMGFVLMGVLAFGLVFFDRRSVLAGAVVCSSVFALNELLMALELVDYAPILSRSPFQGDSTVLGDWWALHLRVIFIVAFFAFFALLLFQMDQLEAQRLALEEMAVTDPLTKASNRRRFGERLEEECRRAARSSRPCALLLCDADHFKKVNDTFGHHAGDEVLKHLATVMQLNVRAGIDVVGRLGGEEFGILLPETALTAAQEVAERIGAQMRGHTFVVDGKSFRVTISIGLVESSVDNPEALLRVADDNLYTAKRDGRDRVVGSVLS